MINDRHQLFGQTAPTSRLKARKSFFNTTNTLPNHPNSQIARLWNEADTARDEYNEVLPPGHNLRGMSVVHLIG